MIRQRTLDPCRTCSYPMRNQHLRLDSAAVMATFAASSLQPADPSARHDLHEPWPAICPFGHKTSPRVANLRHRGGGCRRCAEISRGLLRRLPEAEAADLMRRHGFKPQLPYPGSGTRWLCLCLKSHQLVTPTVDQVRELGHSCPACAQYGVQAHHPAFVYLLHHDDHHALKIGIGKTRVVDPRADRVDSLVRRFGWRPLHRLRVSSGSQARAVEAAVLTYWRSDLDLPPFLGPLETSGWTETVSDDVCADCSWSVALQRATNARAADRMAGKSD